MPNYVATEIRVKGDKEKLDQLVEAVSSNDGTYCAFDFNKIVPMPEELNIPSCSSGEWGMKYIILKSDKDNFLLSDEDRNFIKQFESHSEEDIKDWLECGKKYLHNLSKYCYKTWYDWCMDPSNWNTKWNSCDSECSRIDDNEVMFTFSTAWSFCTPVIKKLSEMYPELDIEFMYSDEDASYNCGSGTLKGGEYIEYNTPDYNSNAAYRIYLDLHPYDEDRLVYDPEQDRYKWIEDE